MAIQVSEVQEGGGKGGIIKLLIGIGVLAAAAYIVYKYFMEDSADGPQGQGITVVLPENLTNAANVPWSGDDYDLWRDELIADIVAAQEPVTPIAPVADVTPTDIATVDTYQYYAEFPVTIFRDFADEGVIETKTVPLQTIEVPEVTEPTVEITPRGGKPVPTIYT